MKYWGQISLQVHFIKTGRKSVQIGFCALFPGAHFSLVQVTPILNFSTRTIFQRIAQNNVCYCHRASWTGTGSHGPSILIIHSKIETLQNHSIQNQTQNIFVKKIIHSNLKKRVFSQYIEKTNSNTANICNII